MPAIALPKPLSVAQFVPTDGPSYTQIFNDTVGNLATPGDDLELAMADLNAIGDAFGVALAGDAAAGTLDTAINLLAGFDPSGLDASIVGYEGAKEIGAGIVARTDGLTTPTLLELPMSITFDGGIGAAPTQQSVDLGKVKLGAAPIVTDLGNWSVDATGQAFGLIDAYVAIKTGGNWLVDRTEVDNNTGFSHGHYFVQFTPDTVGDFICQVNVFSVVVGESTIITYKVSVIP